MTHTTEGTQRTPASSVHPRPPAANNPHKKRGKFQPSSGPSHTVTPVGRQRTSLPSVSNNQVNFSRDVKFGRHQLSSHRPQRKIAKASKQLPSIRTVLSYAHSATLHTINSLHLGSIMHTGATISNKHFIQSFKLFRGIGVATQSLSLITQSGKTGIQAIRDISAHRSRTTAQELLKEYDPETRTLTSKEHAKSKLQKLKELLKTDNGRLARTKTQIALDRFIEIKTMFVVLANLVESALLLTARFTSVVGPALPGAGVAASSITFIKSAITSGVQIVALNNLASAQAATKDPLLLSLAGHIKQERSIKARQELISASISALSAISNTGAAFIGPGALAGIIIAGGLSIGSAIGTQAFNAYHARKLNKQRKLQFPLPQDSSALSNLAKNNIGVAERAFLQRLRKSTEEELKESVVFLRNLGVAESTIKQLQLAPEKVAMTKFKEILYQDKLKYKGLQLKQTGKTFLHVTGANALGRCMKTSSRWLAHKVKTPHNQKTSLLSTPEKESHKKLTTKQPSLTTYLLRRHQGYSILST